MTARSLRVPMTRIPTFRAYRTAITECGSKRAHDRRRGEGILGCRLLHKSHKSGFGVGDMLLKFIWSSSLPAACAVRSTVRSTHVKMT